MPSGQQKTLGIIGAGKLGTVVARLATRAGYTVSIAGSGDPKKIELSMRYIVPDATAVSSDEAIRKSNIVILALPLGKYRELPADILNGKLVIDAMNYWWEVDGNELEKLYASTSSSEAVQAYFVGARVIKALSHMGYHHLFDEAKQGETKNRKAIAIAGNDSNDTHVISRLIEDIGFDPVIISPLASGRILEPGHELFGANITEKELRAVAAKEL